VVDLTDKDVDSKEYHRDECVTFCKTREEFGGLSNMAAGFPLEINGNPIRTSEALYQACKFPHSPTLQRIIIDQASPMAAKMKSKGYPCRADWDKIKDQVMGWCLRVKLAQNWTTFGELLLKTQGKYIVELSHRDVYWGAKQMREDVFVGRNALGCLLMDIRVELLGDRVNELRVVHPPDIPGFLLFSEPILAVSHP
jgi:type I restriction enzyme S subunit